MDNTGKGNNHTSKIARRVNLLRNGEKWKMHKTDWFEGGLKLEYIATNNSGENDLNPWIE